ncbi:MAG: heavy-metal-associated domain-containing protein [Bacteroidetes bacterium]|nr:heavy-metal-associated domain-containing protein [Bacteroidota bacterium]
MNTFQFKTNINCGGCINAVKPHLDKANNITEWKVDTDNPDKILTVSTENLSKEEIIEIIQKAGFKIEALEQ